MKHAILAIAFLVAAPSSDMSELRTRIDTLEVKDKLSTSVLIGQQKQIEQLQKQVNDLESRLGRQIPSDYSMLQIQQLQRDVASLQKQLKH